MKHKKLENYPGKDSVKATAAILLSSRTLPPNTFMVFHSQVYIYFTDCIVSEAML